MKTIRLQATQDRYFRGHAKYVVSYDHAAGRRNCYYVWLLNAGDPVTIGRELPLKETRQLIAEYEEYFAKNVYYGDRRAALKALSFISSSRLALLGPRLPAKVSKQVSRVGKHKPDFRGAMVR